MSLTEAQQLALLAEHEPVLAFTRGELFFPIDAEEFVAACSLWRTDRGKLPDQIVAAGDLSTGRLVTEARRAPTADLQLRFVTRPLRGREYHRWRTHPGRERLASRGRLTKVGLLARFVDALFRVGLLLRGRIPGGFAAAAEVQATEAFASSGPAYHGRVVADGGYVALQYWFFYAMNDWRSTFGGVNDHEGDWELVTVYLGSDDDGTLVPRWVGFSSHDVMGDELRRRIDDPELELVDGHPLIYVGAGSHSCAVQAGDYVVAVAPPVIRPVLAFFTRIVSHLSRRPRPPKVEWRIPYVDYARGDGRRIGPGTGTAWNRTLIDDRTPWVRDFRGLWGLDTGDRFGGERAPAGPRFERSGAVRTAWADPLGWVGLHKVPPSDAEARRIRVGRLTALEEQMDELDEAVELLRVRLLEQRLSEQAAGVDHARAKQQAASDATERELAASLRQRAAVEEEHRLLRIALDEPAAADDPRAHLRHPHVPYAVERRERDRFLRVWATVSSPLLVAAMVFILLRPPAGALTATGAVLVIFFAVEALARKRALAYIGAVTTVVLAVGLSTAAAALLLTHWRVGVSVLLGLAAFALLVLNVSDLRRG